MTNDSTPPRRALPRLLLAFLLTSVLLPGMASAIDLRTKTVRLVPQQAFQVDPTPISIRIECDEHELAAHLEDFAGKAFNKLGYSVSDDTDLRFVMVVDSFDEGSQTKRLLTGFGGKGSITGSLVFEQSGKEVGRYRFSSKLRGGLTAGSVKAMAKEVAPPLILKWTKGQEDTELHEP